jgi:2-keto-3-deoxy-L-rhamnonate aldolase RhmA
MNGPMIDKFRELLAGGPQLGLDIMYPAPGIIERIGPDWDWVWIDGQHGELDEGDVLEAVRACNLIGRPAVVRVPGHDMGVIGKALDTAAEGIMVPLINDADQAQAAVEAAKFPPLGSRSYGGRRPIDLLGRGYSDPDQPQPMLVCQIETPTGLENAEAIAAVEGVDVLFFGPDDMAMRAGLSMDAPRPEGYFDEAMQRVADAARSQGKLAGGAFVTPKLLRQAADMGYRLIAAMADVLLLVDGSQQTARMARDALDNTK